MRMKPNRILKAAALLWVLAAATAAMWPGTQAKYTASAAVTATAAVAKWDAFERIDPAALGDDGEPIQLYLKRAAVSRTTTITLANNSEVAARYVLAAYVNTVKPVGAQTGAQARQAFLAAVMASIEANPGYDGGIPLGMGATASLQIEIPNATFTGLELTATATQID